MTVLGGWRVGVVAPAGIGSLEYEVVDVWLCVCGLKVDLFVPTGCIVAWSVCIYYIICINLWTAALCLNICS